MKLDSLITTKRVVAHFYHLLSEMIFSARASKIVSRGRFWLSSVITTLDISIVPKMSSESVAKCSDLIKIASCLAMRKKYSE